MLEDADGDHLVVAAEALADVRLVHGELALQTMGSDLRLHPVGLLGGGVDAGNVGTVLLGRVEHEAAEAAAHVDDVLARYEPDLAGHVLHLGDLRIEYALAGILVVGTGVHEVGLVEHLGVELGTEAVVEARVLLGARAGAVVEAQSMPAVTHGDQQPGRLVEPRVESDGHDLAEVAVNVDIAIEIRFEHADVTVGERPPSRTQSLEMRNHALAATGDTTLDHGPIGQDDGERQFGGGGHRSQYAANQRARDSFHGHTPRCSGGKRSKRDITSGDPPACAAQMWRTVASAPITVGALGRFSKAMRMLSDQA